MTARRFIFWAHLISGIAVGGVIFIMALTGTILAFEPQIVEFAEKKIQKVAVIEAFAVPMSVAEILSKAVEAMPGGRVSGILLKSDPEASAVVSFGREGGSIYLNPYTGEILGAGSKTHDFMHWVEDIHRKLGAKDKGKAVTGFCNAVFLFMVISGIYIWFPRNWNLPSLKAITLFNGKLSGKQRDWNWHNVIGFWCLPMLLVTTLTGLVMSYGWANTLLFRMMGSEPPAPIQRMAGPEGGPRQGGEKGQAHQPAELPLTQEDVDLIGFEVESRTPDWVSINLRFPQKPGAPVTVSIQESKEKHNSPNPRSSLSYDLESGEVTKWEPYAEGSLGKKARVWVKYLHTGQAWGWIGQLIAFISAVGALFLVYTGFALSWHRFFSKK
ncbi:MAG TPA: PepSY-associated TM helix domain-containing protein [Candidatus Omnitrophota bacterium]|nr:PepSY-associated TM helix domain-containing protein [Candidatus Omnitrophota bacterium]